MTRDIKKPEVQPDVYTLAAEAGAFGPPSPAFDINNSEYCPKHDTWFGRMPCPTCYGERRSTQPVSEIAPPFAAAEPYYPALLGGPHACEGAQYPCDREATSTVIAMDGSDMETARMVALHYCRACYDEMYDLSRYTDPPPPPPDPSDNPDIDNTPATEGPSPLRRPHAVTLQSIAIEQTMRRCHNCGADHRTWQCPDIRTALFAPTEPAPWSDPDLGRELCRMKWQNFRGFVALLLSVPTAHLVIYAASYQAFIRSYRPESDLTIHEILQVWARDMRRGGDRGQLGAQQVAV